MEGYLFTAAWLAALLITGLKLRGLIASWFRQKSSQNWPWAKSTIESGVVESIGDEPRYRISVFYSYTVEYATYGGVYRENFRTEKEARAALTSLQELPPPVRYRPSDPSHSVMDPYRDAALGLSFTTPA